jgi:hypothetical protein
MLFSLDAVIVHVSPFHAHELIIAGNDIELWSIDHFLFVEICHWVSEIHCHCKCIRVNILSDISIDVIMECKGEAVVRLPLGMNISNQVRNDWDHWCDSNNFCCTAWTIDSSSHG